MLSRIDILKELGKGINIFPLNMDNIKENSVNLCTSKFAWATDSCDIYINENEQEKEERFSLTETVNSKKYRIEKGKSAVVKNGDKEYIILLPLSTTLIETKEVLSIGENIGGTYHSKVGMVSKGLGHVGTMLGPNFSGDSLIAIHNVSGKLLVLEVGESFISVVFHYLDTPYTQVNPTQSGHIEKFSQFGIRISDGENAELNADWKKKRFEVRTRMMDSEQYERVQKELRNLRKANIKGYLNWTNAIILVTLVVTLAVLFLWAKSMDQKTGGTVWVDRFFNVGCSGTLVAFVTLMFSHIKKR